MSLLGTLAAAAPGAIVMMVGTLLLTEGLVAARRGSRRRKGNASVWVRETIILEPREDGR